MNTIYSPARIGVLMHIHCRPVPLDACIPASPVRTHTIEEFLADGVIVEDVESGSGFSLTDRGKAWVRSICNTPIPRPAWVDGSGKIITG